MLEIDCFYANMLVVLKVDIVFCLGSYKFKGGIYMIRDGTKHPS